MPSTVAPTSRRPMTKRYQLGGKCGDRNTTFMGSAQWPGVACLGLKAPSEGGQAYPNAARNRTRPNNRSMRVRCYESAGAFSVATRPFLVEYEAHNNVLLGISGTLAAEPSGGSDEDAYLAVVEDDLGLPAAAAVMTPPWNVLLSWPFPEP